MNLYKINNKVLQLLSVSFLICLMSAPVQAAKYVGDSDGINKFDSDEFSELIKSKPQLTAEQLKKNYQTVLLLIKDKKIIKAKAKVNSFIREYPKQSLYLNLKALLQLLDKDVSAAEKSFIKAINLNQNNIQAYLGIAKIALNNKQYVRADEYANKVLEKNLYLIKAYQILADSVMQQKGIEAVEKFLLTSQIRVQDNPNAELGIIKLLGKLYARKKQPDSILKLAMAFAKKHPSEINALTFQALAQISNKDNLAAEKTLRNIITLEPTDVKHRILLVRLLDKQKNKESEMLALLDDAAENKKNLDLVLSYKTAILIKQKKYQQAFNVAKRVEKENPKTSVGKILLADVKLASQQYDEALQYYLQAYDITPNNKVLDAILRVYNKLGQSNYAVSFLENEYASNEKNLAIKFRLAIAYQQLKKYEQSVKYYEELLVVEKDNIVVLNNLAWIYSKQGNPKALDVAAQAYQYAPKSGTVADTYGYTMLRLGDKTKALEILKQAIVLDPVLVDIQVHLAEAYIANEQYPEAKLLLEKINTIDTAITHKANRLLEML